MITIYVWPTVLSYELSLKSDFNTIDHIVYHSLQTLCNLSKAISDKWRQSHPKFDLIDHTIGRDDLELKAQVLVLK